MTTTRVANEFLWGAGTSAYQIEGAWEADGKGESNWDRWCHIPGKIKGGGSGDVAVDHYHRWPEDVRLMRELGLKAYRFSVAWSRVQPTGRGALNPLGVSFYDRLIDALLAAGVKPLVTLCHYDYPQALNDQGGWVNRAMADWFAEYAAAMVKAYGDRVDHWMTINEPVCITDGHVPGERNPERLAAIAHHLLLGHGRALQALKQTGGERHRVGLVCNLYPIQPFCAQGAGGGYTPSERGNPGDTGDLRTSDAPLTPENMAEAVRQADGRINRMFLDPIYRGEYPADIVAGLPHPPPVRTGDMEIIGRRSDFLGVNYYSRIVVRPVLAGPGKPIGWRSCSVAETGGQATTMGWEVYPHGLHELLTRIRRDYGDPDMLITENGMAIDDPVAPDGRIHDDYRIEYLRQHIAQVRRCLADGIKLRGYVVWSLLDNFEWEAGWGQRFGLIYVDYASLKRTIKDSGYWYRDLIAGKEVASP
jgi:beta-glucosidase